MIPTTTTDGMTITDYRDVSRADTRVEAAHAAREAAIERVVVAQARILELRTPLGDRVTELDRAEREKALDEADAANDARAEAATELHAALRDREQAVRRAVGPVAYSWRCSHAAAVADARDAVQAALAALHRVACVEERVAAAVRHPSVRVTAVPQVGPSVGDVLEALGEWCDVVSRS